MDHDYQDVAVVAATRPRQDWSRMLQWGFLVVVLAALLAQHDLPIRQRQVFTEITRVFLSIVLEALPFMLIGSLASGIIEVFISRQRLASILAKGKTRSVLLAAGLGMIFPVCDCAVVPVVRRLLRKGAPLSAAVAYLLAGPIVNPVVIAATAVAYRQDWRIVAARAGIGYVIAVTIGLLMGRFFRSRPALRPEAGQPHEHLHCDCGHDHDDNHVQPLPVRFMEALRHAADDFLDIARFLIVGALVAGVLRGAMGQQGLLAAARNPLPAILVMMALGFVLNLCSEADAFVAASFRGLVPVAVHDAWAHAGRQTPADVLPPVPQAGCRRDGWGNRPVSPDHHARPELPAARSGTMTTPSRRRFSSSVLTYLCWSAALAWLFVSKGYLVFLAPKFGGLLVGASLLLLVFAIASLAGTRAASSGSRDNHVPSCLILLCPLAFLLMVPVGPAGSYAFEARSGTQTLAKPYAGATAANAPGGKADPHQSLLDICMGYPGNVGQQVVTEGMVDRIADIPSGSIVLFRFAITCCAADAQPVGVLVTGKGLEGLTKDTWIRVSGKLTKTRIKDQDVPTIEVQTIERIKPPADPYLY
jgi:uncharacterized repeat protein (TIGR03943 family)